jgi:hypothetical protein
MNLLRILIILLLAITSIQCSNKPYQPNYNKARNHNGDLAGRSRIIERQTKRDINAANKARRKASKTRVLRMNRRHEKKSEKRTKSNYSRGRSKN